VAPLTDPSGKDIGLAGEVGRKAIHLGALVMPIGLWLVPWRIAIPVLLLSFSVSLALDLSRRRGGRMARLLDKGLGRVLRPHESSRFSGATFILAAGALCPLLFSRPVAVAALICIILGDIAAVFVGRSIGRIRIGDKTLEGSMGFFTAALLGILWIPQLPLHVKVIGALTATVAEALPQPIDDNLIAPLAAGAVMTALLA
jgi:dolichol kinase